MQHSKHIVVLSGKCKIFSGIKKLNDSLVITLNEKRKKTKNNQYSSGKTVCTCPLISALVAVLVLLLLDSMDRTRLSHIGQLIIPAKARDYVFTGVGLSVCLSVCYHDN